MVVSIVETESVLVHQVGDSYGDGAGDAGDTVDQHAMRIVSALV